MICIPSTNSFLLMEIPKVKKFKTSLDYQTPKLGKIDLEILFHTGRT